MATTKRTANKVETMTEAGAEAPINRAARAKRSPLAADSASPAPKRTTPAEPKSPAATHKAPARKAKVTAAAAATTGPAFDLSQHHEEIAREAYHLWLSRGCGHGEAHEDWTRAEALVRERITSGR
jgi:hypothetical protein